jgi:hypothetical protein
VGRDAADANKILTFAPAFICPQRLKPGFYFGTDVARLKSCPSRFISGLVALPLKLRRHCRWAPRIFSFCKGGYDAPTGWRRRSQNRCRRQHRAHPAPLAEDFPSETVPARTAERCAQELSLGKARTPLPVLPFAIYGLSVMTALYTRFRHDDVFLQEHSRT